MTSICNRAEVEGTVVSVGELTSTRFGTVILPFVLEVERRSGGTGAPGGTGTPGGTGAPGRTDRVPCCAMDQYAEELEGILSVGTELHVDGVLRWNAKRQTLGVCIRPPRGVWWMPDPDEPVPLSGEERAAELARCRREIDRITAEVNGWKAPPEHESAQEAADRVRRELEAFKERCQRMTFTDEPEDEKDDRGAYDFLRRASEAQETPRDTTAIASVHPAQDGSENESEDDAIKRMAQEIEDFIKLKESMAKEADEDGES